MTKLLFATAKNIERAAVLIRSGGVIAFPTETVYGLGANAFNPQAMLRIFEIKNRPSFDPLIVHIANIDSVKKLCADVSPLAKKLMKKFWPGPLTLVLPKNKTVPDVVTSGLPTVAVRMPSHPVALALVRCAGVPIAAPSANPFGCLSPTTAAHVIKYLDGQIDLVLDGGKCPMGVESTIFDLTGEKPTLLRPGALSIEAIKEIVGEIGLNRNPTKPLAPGGLPQHYSPQTPLKLINNLKVMPMDHRKKKGLLTFRQPKNELPFFQRIEVLSQAADLREAAANLFSCLHKLDEEGLDVIYAEHVPEVGLGRAIMDRLRRASS